MKYTKNVIIRYILFQIPELALTVIILLAIKYFYDFSAWIFWLIIFISILKDLFLFFKTWPAYVVHKQEEYSNIMGKTGIANSDFVKSGYININGELWKVEVSEPVRKGDNLIVTDVKGLIIKAIKDS